MNESKENQTLSKRGGVRAGAGRKPKSNLAAPPPATSIAFAAFDGAEWSPRRANINFPRDSRKELTGRNRSELARIARYAVNNDGLARRLVYGTARYSIGGGIVPEPDTEDNDWNEQAAELFENRWCKEAWGFSADASVNFYQAQQLIVRQMATDGDFFGQFMTSDSSGQAMVRFIPSEYIGNSTRASLPDQSRWQDGVMLDAYQAPIMYRVLADPAGENFTDVPAEDIRHFRRPDRCGYHRSPSWLAHGITALQDIIETMGYCKDSFKLAARIGLIITSPEAGRLALGDRLTTTTTGTSPNTAQKVSDILGNTSGETQLKPGESVTTIKNEHPGNLDPFLDVIIRGICTGFGCSPDVMWKVENLGGANARLALQDAQTFFAEVQDLVITQFCQPAYKYFIWHEIVAGRLPFRDDWWECDWITPQRVTVDVGRDGALMINLVKERMLSRRRWFNMQGLNFRKELKECVEDEQLIAEFLAKNGIERAEPEEPEVPEATR